MKPSDPLPELVRAFRKLLIEADVKHSPPSVISFTNSFDAEDDIVLPLAAVQLAAKVAGTRLAKYEDALELALCAHYDPDLTQAQINALVNEAIEDDILKVATALKLPLVIDPDGRVWSTFKGYSLYHRVDCWHITMDEYSFLAPNLAEAISIAVKYRTDGTQPDGK